MESFFFFGNGSNLISKKKMLKLFWLHGMWLDAQEIKFWIKVKKKKNKK